MPDEDLTKKVEELEEKIKKFDEIDKRLVELEKPIGLKQFSEVKLDSDSKITHLYQGDELKEISGVSDHGALSGLEDDDHPQYLKDIVEDTTPQLGGDLDLNEKNLDLDAVPSTDNTGIGMISDDINAGESIAFPNLVYLKSDGKWWKVDADAFATCQGLIGIALETKTDGQACKVLLNGFVRDDDWTWTVAGPIYASTTAGGLTQTAPSGTDDVIKIVGVATHADRMYLHPEMTTVVHI